MVRRAVTTRSAIVAILLLQLIPLMLFPPESYSVNSQEWWLPVLLAVLVAVADVYLIVRREAAPWPWHLMSFSQGFNVISRLMMVWPHAVENGAVNVAYIVLTALSIGMSAFMLWFSELPEVRMGLLSAE